MNEFHPSRLEKGHAFRDSLRFKAPFSTERLDAAHAILTDALGKHGAETLTEENYTKVSEHMRKDPRWQQLYSAGPEFENALKAHLNIQE